MPNVWHTLLTNRLMKPLRWCTMPNHLALALRPVGWEAGGGLGWVGEGANNFKSI
jgi:hypothetical protein